MGKKIHEPIGYKGEILRSSKTGSKLSAHFCSEDEALERIKTEMEKVGITRLANITGLDRIGIPVYNSIKPTANGFSVQHGKGMSLKASKISAAMESFERFYGLGQRIDFFQMTYRELEKKYRVIPYHYLPLSKYSIFHPDLPVEWCLGWDIVNQEEVAVPRQSVRIRSYKIKKEWKLFQMTSNGLSAGFDFLEAILQGLLEVIERDAVTCSMHAARRVGSVFPLHRLRLDTIQSPDIGNLLRKIEDASVLPLIYDCRVNTDVPTFKCYLLDKLDPMGGISYGMGASLEPEEAMVRAINEAAMARPVFNSGARDASSHEEFKAYRLGNSALLVKNFENEQGTTDVSHIRSESGETFHEDILICIDKLKAVGLDQVIVFPLTEKGNGITAVRVIVPGLEGYLLPDYRPGLRAQAYLGGKAT
ncbi:MAG: YcaO-like family protein [Candidatus Omnitrophota bacterium]